MLIPFVTLFTGTASLAVFVSTLVNFDDYWRLLAVMVGINLPFNAYIIVQYQRASHTRQYGLLVWTVITFAIYNYLLYPAIMIAFCKKISGRTNWVKTTHGIKRKSGRKSHEKSAKNDIFTSALTNVSRQAISKWEVGSTYPDIDRLVQISNLFDITLDSLIKGDDSLKKQKVNHPMSLS